VHTQNRQSMDLQSALFGLALGLIKKLCASPAGQLEVCAGQLRLQQRMEESGDEVPRLCVLWTRSALDEPHGDGSLERGLDRKISRDGFDALTTDREMIDGDASQQGAGFRGLEIEQGAEKDFFPEGFRRGFQH